MPVPQTFTVGAFGLLTKWSASPMQTLRFPCPAPSPRTACPSSPQRECRSPCTVGACLHLAVDLLPSTGYLGRRSPRSQRSDGRRVISREARGKALRQAPPVGTAHHEAAPAVERTKRPDV